MSNPSDSSGLVENMETSDISTPEKKGKSPKSGGKPNQKSPKESGSGGDEEMHTSASIPTEILRRVNALRKLQMEALNFETDFYRKIHELECDYAEKLVPLNEKRKKIVTGFHEPNEEECDVSVPFDDDCLADELEKQAAIKKDLPEAERNAGAKGLDEFWITVFRNDSIMGGLIQFHDEPVLKHLTDVEVKASKDPMMFTLYFHFSPNEFFTNTALTKEYIMKCQPEADDPFAFEGPEIVACKGCKIDWKAGKNVTVQVVKKKQKHKQKGGTRIVAKEVKAESFFNFFDPPVIPDDVKEVDEDVALALNTDYEIGQLLRDRVIPRAVLYYTGEAMDPDEDYEDEDMDDDEDDDESDEEEESDEGEGENGHQGKK